MIANGLNRIPPDRKDYSLLHTFGALDFDPNGLPANFSIYDGRVIPDQNNFDTRFTPPLPPLPFGCTGESQSFLGGLEDGVTYNPQFTYAHTPPGGDSGRDMRASLQTTIDTGFQSPDGTVGNKRLAYFNVYGAGKIDDFDAARIAIWINQLEKRAVSAGTYWYPEFETPIDGVLSLPSFNTSHASMHNHVITGWATINGKLYLEDASWQGTKYGRNGICYISREIYNGLMAQPYTGAFTITKVQGNAPIPLGYQAIIDHFVYWVRNLFNV